MAYAEKKLVDVVVFLLNDGACVQLPNHDCGRVTYECGDVVDIDVHFGDGKEPAVVLGCGNSQEEALQKGREYLRRVARTHGQKPSEVTLFGRELSQSQVVQDMDLDQDSPPEDEEPKLRRSKRFK